MQIKCGMWSVDANRFGNSFRSLTYQSTVELATRQSRLHEYHPVLPVIICAVNVFNFYLTDWLLGEKIWFILEFIHITFNVTTQYQIDLWALFMEINSFNNIELETHCFQTSMIRLGLSISLFSTFSLIYSLFFFYYKVFSISPSI